MVTIKDWERYQWLRHAFSTRADGDARQALPGWPSIARVRQVHGNHVVPASDPAGHPAEPTEADGIVTAQPGRAIGILTADCVPILLADTRLRVVAALHAGWRGTAAAIATAGVRSMVEKHGSRPQDLIAAIGPSIGPCCYAVGPDLHAHFAPGLFTGDHLDLWEANRRQLAAAGVPDITVLAECTGCTFANGERKYFSYRLERGAENWTGRMMAAIAIA